MEAEKCHSREQVMMSLYQTTEMAAILAHILAPLSYPTVIPAMDNMTKADLVLKLRSHGEEPPEKWTKLELRQRLQDLIQSGEVAEIQNVKEKTPLQTATTELNKHSRRKAELIQYVTDEYNIVPTSNDTIGTIQRKAMTAILANTTPTGADLMGFGKFSGRTYQSVMDEEPKRLGGCRCFKG